MKKFNGKACMVITLFLASLVATPVMVAGSTHDNDFDLDQFDNPGDLIGGFGAGFANIFRGLGYGGELLAAVFEMLLMQTLTNFSGKETLPGVYVLSAFQEKTVSHKVRDYSGGNEEIYLLPYEYLGVSAGVYNPNTYGYPYCKVTQFGTYQYNITVGVGVTLVIWDQDNSFVNAVKKIITFFNKIFSYIERGALDEITEDLIREGIELITWFLIHINDIFTGDELFVLNPITWQKLEIKTDPTFSVTKEWFYTNNDWQIDGDDMPIAGSAVDSALFMWNETAKARKDSYMQWLLTETDDVSLLEDVYTSFSFDLIQLWIKNFEIHINVAAALDLITKGGGTVDVAEIFQGLDIEFYLFTHHLAGAFLYNDTNDDNKLSANYVQVNQTGTNIPVLVDGKPVEVPIASELTHRLILGTVDNFQYNLPLVEGGKIKWGLKLNQPTITPVPVGVDLDSYLGASEESLAYIDFGFSFEPKTIELATEEGGTVPVLHGAVKVIQNFAPWNEIPTPPYYGAINDILGLDLAIVYVSTILHFHLNIETLGEEPEEKLDPLDDYDNITHTIKIGNYLPENIRDKLEFVDIAGPDYYYGAEGSATSAPASTNILPLSFFKTEREMHETYEGAPAEVEPFAADIGLNVSFSVMIYAICFSEFDDGTGIWHDPTFSVYMIFEAKGFWAIILLVAGVGLVGVATILIKRRKDARF